MENTGAMPSLDTCDIRFRNGETRRAVDPRKWRWKPWDFGLSDWDITHYQPITHPLGMGRGE